MKVPFPHVERPLLVPRPAVVLTPRPMGPDGLLIWVAMITSAARADWPGDLPVPGAERIGLLIPSKVRTAKIAALETASASKIGELDRKTFASVVAAIRGYLGLDSDDAG